MGQRSASTTSSRSSRRPTKTMAKDSVELGSRGTMRSQTLAAIPAEDLVEHTIFEGSRRGAEGGASTDRAGPRVAPPQGRSWSAPPGNAGIAAEALPPRRRRGGRGRIVRGGGRRRSASSSSARRPRWSLGRDALESQGIAAFDRAQGRPARGSKDAKELMRRGGAPTHPPGAALPGAGAR